MISKTKQAFIVAVLVTGFTPPVFADCLESGAAESCSDGGYEPSPQAWPDGRPVYGIYRGDAMPDFVRAPRGGIG
jgi:hypothetical protein